MKKLLLILCGLSMFAPVISRSAELKKQARRKFTLAPGEILRRVTWINDTDLDFWASLKSTNLRYEFFKKKKINLFHRSRQDDRTIKGYGCYVVLLITLRGGKGQECFEFMIPDIIGPIEIRIIQNNKGPGNLKVQYRETQEGAGEESWNDAYPLP